MNLLLLAAEELDAAGRACLRDRRAQHAHRVWRASPGQPLQAGLLHGPLGTAVVEHCDEAQLIVHTCFDRPAPAALDWLLLAVPRPKVLLRMLADAAALGFAHILLFRSWRVEKSHLRSAAMQPAVQREALLHGLEQGARTQLPTLSYQPLFKPMVEDHLPALPLPRQRFVADPKAATGTSQLALSPTAAFALAVGPEGGFLPYEVEQLAQRGFLPVHAARHPLRNESALSLLSGQMQLLRSRARGCPPPGVRE